MPLVVTVSSSPSATSRSDALLALFSRDFLARGIEIAGFGLRDFAAEDLLFANFQSPDVIRLRETVARADGVVVASPIYKAAFSGALKVILDLLPEAAFEGKAVLPIVTAGGPAHFLSIDYALKPVLAALKPRHIGNGFYATDSELPRGTDGSVSLPAEVEARFNSTLDSFADHLGGWSLPARRVTNTAGYQAYL